MIPKKVIRSTTYTSALRLKRLILCVAALTLTFNAEAQNKIDSLKQSVAIETGTDKYEALISLAVAYYELDSITSALEPNLAAVDLAKSLGDTMRVLLAGRMVGQLYNRLAKPAETSRLLKKVLRWTKMGKHSYQRAGILLTLGIAYSDQALYDSALWCLIESYKLRREENDPTRIATALHNIGLVYYKLKDHGKALVFYRQVINQKRSSGSLDPINLINAGLSCSTTPHVTEIKKVCLKLEEHFQSLYTIGSFKAIG